MDTSRSVVVQQSDKKGKASEKDKMEKSAEEEERRNAHFASPNDLHADDDTGDEEEEEEEDEETENGKQPSDDQARAKREKRLAMNRASARERRRRKRILLEKLEERVLELTKRNTSLQELNEEMQGRVQQLEVDLARANSLITTLSTGSAGGGTAARAAALDGANPILSALLGQELDNERLRSLLTLQTVAGGSSGARSLLQGGGASSTDALLTEVLAERQILQGLLSQQQRRSLLGGSLGGGDNGLAPRSSLLGATGMSGSSYLGARRGGNTLASPEIRTPRLSLEETKMEGILPGSTLTPPRSSSTFGDDVAKKKSAAGKKAKGRRMEGDTRARKRVRGN